LPLSLHIKLASFCEGCKNTVGLLNFSRRGDSHCFEGLL